MKSGSHAVLFVDDEKEILNALKRTMRLESFPCLYADSAHKAVKLMAAQPVSVLISDMRMPEMDGPQLLKYTRVHYPDTIPLVLSGFADSEDILSAINNGQVYRYIVKPWNNDELRAIVRQAMELHKLQWEKKQLMRQLEAQNYLLEQKIESRNQQLLKISSHAEIGKYASQIVHNLKNPLQVLFGALGLSQKLMESDKADVMDRLNKYISMAKKSAGDLQQIVAGILMHVRDDAHQRPTAININEVIRLQLNFFEMDTMFRDEVEKQIELKETLPAIYGNSIQIKQMIDNLIRNALDAMEDRPDKILTVQTESDAKSVIIKVSDTGVGILKEDLDYIFNPDYSTKPMDKGTGLGLASVQTMVNAYGGDIEVASKIGQGATFTITIPVTEEPNAKIHDHTKADTSRVVSLKKA